jgi:hypothetical protein
MVLFAVIGVFAGPFGIADAGKIVPRSGGSSVIAPMAAILLGPTARLPVAGRDSENPELAMNTSGRYLVAYPDNDPFGPFGVLSATPRSGRVSAGGVITLGTMSDLSPVQPAVAADGRVAVGWAVRRGLRRSPYAIFGLELAERVPGSTSRWTYRQVLAPTDRFDPSDLAGGIAFDSFDRLFWAWTTHVRAVASLVLARQSSPDGPLQTQTVATAGRYTTIAPAPIAVDGAGSPVLAWSLTPAGGPLRSNAPPTIPAPTAMAATATTAGHVGHVQVLRRGCYVEQLVVAPSGQAAVSMGCPIGHRGTRTQVWVSERPPGGVFGKPLLVAAKGPSELALSLTIAGGGRVWAVWDHVVGTERSYDANIVRTEVSSALPGQPFPPPSWETAPYPTQLNPPELLITPAGGVVLARGDRLGRVVLQPLENGGHLGTAIVLSPQFVRNQQVATDANGRGLAIWDTHIAGANIPQARPFTLHRPPRPASA